MSSELFLLSQLVPLPLGAVSDNLHHFHLFSHDSVQLIVVDIQSLVLSSKYTL